MLQIGGVSAGLASAFCFGCMGFFVHALHPISGAQALFFRGLFAVIVLWPFLGPDFTKRLFSRDGRILWLRAATGSL